MAIVIIIILLVAIFCMVAYIKGLEEEILELHTILDKRNKEIEKYKKIKKGEKKNEKR